MNCKSHTPEDSAVRCTREGTVVIAYDISPSVHYSLRPATRYNYWCEVHAPSMVTYFHPDCNTRKHCTNHDHTGVPNGPIVW